MSSEPPDELKRRLPHEPKLWVRNYLRHPEDPSRPYDFYDSSGEKFLHYLTDDEGPLNPKNWGDVNILLFARGMLKTFTCTSIMGWGVDMFPTIEVAATAPVDDQRYEVIDRFKDKAEESGLSQRRVKDKLSHQKFRNYTKDSDGQSHQSYSHVKSRSAWGDGDKLRGIHAHLGVIDESQDVDEGTFSTFAMEAVDRQIPHVDYFPAIFVIGTPKFPNSFFHKLWQMAEQRIWDEEAKEWTLEAEGSEFLPDELKRVRSELEEEIEALEAAEEDRSEKIAQLQSQVDGIEGFTVKGWKADQYNSPLHDPARIAFKKQTYPKKKFENEVKANFYSPEDDLIINDDVWASLVEGRGFRSSRQRDDTEVLLGVDWGGGDGEGAANTVVAIGEQYEDGDIDILKFDVFDSSLSTMDEVNRISDYMTQFEVDRAVVDEGFGDDKRQMLQDEFGHDNLFGCYYGNVKNKEEIKWNRFKSQKRFFTTSKSYMVQKFAQFVKDGNLTIPQDDLSFDTRNDLGTMLVDQLTAPYTDRDETVTGRKQLRVISDRSDDIFDAFTYMWMAAKQLGSTRTLKSIKSNPRPGH